MSGIKEFVVYNDTWYLAPRIMHFRARSEEGAARQAVRRTQWIHAHGGASRGGGGPRPEDFYAFPCECHNCLNGTRR